MCQSKYGFKMCEVKTEKCSKYVKKMLVKCIVWYGNDLFDIINNTVIKHKLFVINYIRNNIYIRRLQIEYTTRVLDSM